MSGASQSGDPIEYETLVGMGHGRHAAAMRNARGRVSASPDSGQGQFGGVLTWPSLSSPGESEGRVKWTS